MNQATLKKLLAELKDGLRCTYGKRLKGVFVFGSFARGDQNRDSDLDILVVLENFQRANLEITNTSDLVARLSLAYGITITRFFVTEAEWKESQSSFLLNVREDAVAA